MGARRNWSDWAIFALILACLGASLINLLFVGVNGNPFVFLTCGVAAILLLGHGVLLTMSKGECVGLAVWAFALVLFGAPDYNSGIGLSFSYNAVAASLVFLSAYILARFLLARGLAYPVALIGFLVVLIPSVYTIASGVKKLDELFVFGSENYATSWLIITSLAVCSVRMAEGKPPPLWPVVVTFLIALSQYTRGSILVSFIGLLAIAYVRFGFKWTLVFAVSGALLSLPFGGEIIKAVQDAISSTKFGQRGLETPRWAMWRSYLEYQTFGSFMLGTNTDFVPIIKDFSGNPHNTLVRFHAYFGIIPFMAGIGLLAWGAIRSRNYLIVPVAIMLLRATSDILLVGTVLDLFFMMALVPALLAKPRERRRRAKAPSLPVAKRSAPRVLPPYPEEEREAADYEEHRRVEILRGDRAA